MAYIGRGTDKISNIEKLDVITFDGSSSYTLQKNSVNFTPNSANSLQVSIDGVVQAGNFTVSGSTIDFGVAIPATSTNDFIFHYGTGLITTPADGTVSLDKLSATGTKDATTFLRGDNTFAAAGGGKLLQSSLVTTSTNQALSSTTYTDLTGMSISFTPVSSTSKLLITSFMNIGLTATTGSDDAFFSKVLRDATTINDSDTGVGYGSVYFYVSSDSNMHLFDINVCEDTTHGTTSAVTIKVQGKCGDASDSIQFNLNSSKKSYLLVQEIEQ